MYFINEEDFLFNLEDIILDVTLGDVLDTLKFISVINQLDAQNFCFTISLFHASTCFEHYEINLL